MTISKKILTAAEPIALDRRSDPEVRKRMSGPATRTFLNLAERWKLSVGERRALLGWPSESTYHNCRNGNVGTLSYDVLTRILLLIGMWGAPDRVALRGGSNGGLLMGAMIVQHPELARAVLSEVGIYDTLREEDFPNGAFNVTEFGTVKDAEQFRALYAYSPYHHVEKGTDYPAVFLAADADDNRVNPMQSRKMAAALQWATGGTKPILLHTTTGVGHGISIPVDAGIAAKAATYAFLFHELGMTVMVPPR